MNKLRISKVNLNYNLTIGTNSMKTSKNLFNNKLMSQINSLKVYKLKKLKFKNKRISRAKNINNTRKTWRKYRKVKINIKNFSKHINYKQHHYKNKTQCYKNN